MDRVLAAALMATVALALPSVAVAGQVVYGTVTLVESDANDSLAYITVNGTYEYRPPCSTFFRQRFEVDTRQWGGRNSLALALMARAMGKTLTLYGTGDCRPGGIDERLNFVGLWP